MEVRFETKYFYADEEEQFYVIQGTMSYVSVSKYLSSPNFDTVMTSQRFRDLIGGISFSLA